MQNHALVFDFDGTLVDSLGQAMMSFNHVLDRMGEPPRTAEQIKAHFGSSADRIFSRLLGDETKGLQAFQFYKENQAHLAPQMPLHKGIRELLDLVVEHKVPTAVVTGRHAEDLEIVLGPHGIAHIFLTLIADNHLQRSKPDPEGLLLAAERLKVHPKNILYVGDSHMDIQAIHAAGGQAVAALWDPLANAEAMRAQNPRYLAFTPADVWTSFRDFSGSK